MRPAYSWPHYGCSRAALVLCATACTETIPATEIVVAVESELVVGSEIDELEVRVLEREQLESSEGPTREYALAAKPLSGQHTLPLSFALVPDQDERKDFRVIVTGLYDGEPVVEQQAIVTFQPRKAQLLRMFLARDCLQVLCRDDDGRRTERTCEQESGDCSEVIESTDLPPFTGATTEFPESATTRTPTHDAGSMDTGAANPGSDGDVEAEVVPVDSGADARTVDTGDAQGQDGGVLSDAGPDAGCGPCPLHAGCEGAGVQRCVCQAPYASDDAGACTMPATTTSFCTPSPCQNGGACIASGSTGSCDCSRVDYRGDRCELKIEDCMPNPCGHGGSCTDGIRAHTCACVAGSGFAGPECNDNIDECATSNVCTGTRNTVAFNYPCADSRGTEAGYRCTGQYPNWALPPASAGRFTTSAGVVTDTHTRLLWQQAMSSTMFSLEAARAYCRGLTLPPGSNWRVPTRAELISIVDYPKAAAPAIDTSVFSGTPNTFVWTNSLSVSEPGLAWYINFEFGNASTVSMSEAWYVRCVH